MPHLKTQPYVAVYDRTAGVYEVFRDADCDSYVGSADTLYDCEQIARDHNDHNDEDDA